MTRGEKSWAPALLAVTPFFGLMWFYAYVLHARIILGKWPSFGDTPRSEMFQIHDAILIHCTVFGTPVLLLAACIGFRSFHKKGVKVEPFVYLFLVSVAVAIITLSIDPGRFVDWFLD